MEKSASSITNFGTKGNFHDTLYYLRGPYQKISHDLWYDNPVINMNIDTDTGFNTASDLTFLIKPHKH